MPERDDFGGAAEHGATGNEDAKENRKREVVLVMKSLLDVKGILGLEGEMELLGFRWGFWGGFGGGW